MSSRKVDVDKNAAMCKSVMRSRAPEPGRDPVCTEQMDGDWLNVTSGAGMVARALGVTLWRDEHPQRRAESSSTSWS